MAGIALSMGILGASTGVGAQEVAIKIHHLLPPPATAHAKFLVPWTKKVEESCPGKLKFTIFPSMQLGGNPTQLFDQAKDGLADMTWTVAGYTRGRFTASEVFELPFMTKSAEGSSRALWEYAAANNLFATEFKDVKVLALHTHDEGLIHSNKQVKTLADFKGQKMRGPTFLTTKMLEAFGAVPVGMPVTQVAESLTKGVVDGAIVPWEIVPSTKIHELVKFHTELDAASPALYTATFVFSMNKAKYDALPADARRCLDANSGAALSQWIGKVWDESAAGAKKLAQTRGNTIYTVPAAEVAQWRKAAEPITELWLKEAQAKGLDGAALLKSAQELLKKHDSK